MFFPSEKINLHTHSNYCDHANGGIEDYAASAAASGLEVIGFTEHAPVAGDPISCNMMMHSLPSYVKDVMAAGGKYPLHRNIYSNSSVFRITLIIVYCCKNHLT